MALSLRWSGQENLDRVAETRWMCYGRAQKELAKFQEQIQADPWGLDAEYLLAERDGQAVGTAASLPFTMWARGSPISCQGVAYVGTIKSARRRGGSGPGVASAVMAEVLKKARDRGHVVSALMPFRASFYEHFGYGLVERLAQWTIPLTVLPNLDCEGWRLMAEADRPGRDALWQSAVQSGQCDIQRTQRRWQYLAAGDQDGLVFIDQPKAGGTIRGNVFVVAEVINDRNILKALAWSVDSPEEFSRMLGFLGSLRDEFSAVVISLPGNWPINRLLREPQTPHRPVNHPTPEVRIFTRMQLRVLDHRKFLESLHLPTTAKGRVSVGVIETEQTASRFSVRIESGRIEFSPAAVEPDFQCADRHWAAIATGDLHATQAVHWGLACENKPGAAAVLDALAAGPAPMCREMF